MLKITSRENQRLKRARHVRDGSIKDLIFIEGARLAEEVSRSHLKVSDVFFSESFAVSERGQAVLQKFENPDLAEVSDKIFDTLSDTKTAQGIIVICQKPETAENLIEAEFSTSAKLPLVVMLHGVNNPSNLGAILRTCEAANVEGVVTTQSSAKVFSPKALRGAMGASLRLPIWESADFDAVLNWAKEKNLITVCADVNAKKSYLEVEWKKPHLLIFGSEAHGLSSDERKKIDDNLLIPMENEVESLNLAVSCGVILFEVKRQLSELGA